ncbi:MAG: type II toxin-antitoxin system PemK/MazF family toxin [Chloroflexi bacterium]|nr:type II toxin-antitoxin system PemK/MazF family toxin [Chloroflexota bacterium]
MTVSNVRHGDVVLVPFPLNSPTSTQRRPAVVVSGDYFNSGTGEVVIAPITGHGRAAPRIGDYAVMDWENAGLLGPGTVRARLTTLRSSHLLRKLGALSRRDMEGLSQWLRRVLEL